METIEVCFLLVLAAGRPTSGCVHGQVLLRIIPGLSEVCQQLFSLHACVYIHNPLFYKDTNRAGLGLARTTRILTTSIKILPQTRSRSEVMGLGIKHVSFCRWGGGAGGDTATLSRRFKDTESILLTCNFLGLHRQDVLKELSFPLLGEATFCVVISLYLASKGPGGDCD